MNGLLRVLACILLVSISFSFGVSHAKASAPQNSTPSDSADNEQVVVVANSSVAANNLTVGLTLKELRNIFAMKKRYWSNGNPIKVFVLENEEPSHKLFCKRLLRIFPRQLESIWYRQVYTGTGVAPTRLSSESEMLDMLTMTPGAIGYINKNSYEKMKGDEKTTILNIQ